MAAVITLTAGLGFSAAPAQASIASGICEYGVFISVRGTGAASGSNPQHGGRVWASGGEGLISGLANKMRYDSPYPFVFYSLNYPASTTSPDYFSSVMQGRDTLVNEMNWLADQCGTYVPSIVLAGHSQGGSVIQYALQTVSGRPNLSTKAKAGLKAAASFGDPNFRPGQPYVAPASASGSGRMGQYVQSAADQIASHRFWGWPPGTSGTQGWVYKVRSWCFSTDYWCASGNDQNIHNGYSVNFDAARTWIEYLNNAF